MNYMKTGVLLAGMTGLFLAVGYALGGEGGMILALMIAVGMNAFAFWNSDSMVLRMQHAREVGPGEAPDLYRMIQNLADRADLPMPRVFIIDTDQPNAFATGRSPEKAAVAVTRGLLKSAPEDELAGVMAHELAHVKNRDTLLMTVTATIAGAIGMLAQFAQFSMLFGGRGENRPNPIVMIALIILAPLAAMIVQMAISRSREFEADRVGAKICGNPMALARALQRIEQMARGTVNQDAERNPATAHMFIINPLINGGVDNLFRTHPATEKRVAKLVEMAGSMGAAVGQAPTSRPIKRQPRPTPFANKPTPPRPSRPRGRTRIPTVGGDR